MRAATTTAIDAISNQLKNTALVPLKQPIPKRRARIKGFKRELSPQLQELNKNNTGRVFKPPNGQKEVWLPMFALTLLRTSYLPPNMACFRVPLNMNKLDMKDYMWNVYKIPVASVRSYIQQQKVVKGFAGSRDILPQRGRVYRPKSTKRMIIEMVNVGEHGGPFVWPDPPTDYDAWSKEPFQKMEEAQNVKDPSSKRVEKTKEEKMSLSQQASALLSGKQLWEPNIPIYSRKESVAKSR